VQSWRYNQESKVIFTISLALSLAFHVSNYHITQHIGQFPAMTMLLYCSYLQHDWPIRFAKRIVHIAQKLNCCPTIIFEESDSKDSGQSSTPTFQTRRTSILPVHSRLTWKQICVILFLILWLLLQLYMPIRHVMSEHRGEWSADSFRFSWRIMMVSEPLPRSTSHQETAELEHLPC
jgi:hypothetical protein